mmetsp:Transcript_4420/g.10817  ORF Transcript_4420/g.10817 Transcript_4420/m.10817 type:complete len:561 (-) Transcript_4420:532-2214(-)
MVDAQATASLEFLQTNVGEALAEGFTALSLAQPADGVEFLSTFLSQYAVAAKKKAARDSELKKIAKLKTSLQAEQAERDAVKAAAEKKEADKEARVAACLETLKTTEEWSEETWEEIVHNSSALLGGSAGYLGTLVTSTEEPELQYTNGQESMVDKFLPASQGVTHKIFEEVPAPEVEEGAEPPPHRKFQHCYVPYVTDEPLMKYFTWTKLGAYCAVPLVYQSYFTLDAFAAFLAYEKEPPQPPEPAEGEEADPDWVAPKPEPPAVEVKRAIGVDNLGTNMKLKEGEVERVASLMDAVGESRSRVEFEYVWKQAKMFNTPSEFAEKWGALTGAAPDVDGTVAAYKTKMALEELTETQQALCEAQAAYNVAVKAVGAVAPAVDTLSICYVVQPEVLAVTRCVAYLTGCDDSVLAGGSHGEYNWKRAKKALPGLAEKMTACDLSAPRVGLKNEQRFGNVTSIKPAEIADPVEMGSFGFAVLCYWLDAGCALRQAYMDDEKAKYDLQRAAFEGNADVMAKWYEAQAAKAAAEAAGEDPPEVGEKPEPVPKPTPLAECDDDFIQ